MRTLMTSASVALLALASSSASATLVFQADFNGTGTGTGGAGDIVSVGGTGSMTIPGNLNGGTTAIDASGNLGSGNSLSLNLPQTTSKAGVLLTPTAGHGLSAMSDLSGVTGLGTAGASGQIKLNGAFDLLLRPDQNASTGANYLRVFDTIEDVNSGAIRLNFQTNSSGKPLVEVVLRYTNNTSVSNTAVANMPLVAGTTYHIGVTFSTAVDGVVTMKIFGVTGTGEIDTTSSTNLLATTTFNPDEKLLTTGFTANPFVFGNMNNNPYLGSAARSATLDQFRIYDTDPGTFAAPAQVPEPASVGILGLVGGLALLRRK